MKRKINYFFCGDLVKLKPVKYIDILDNKEKSAIRASRKVEYDPSNKKVWYYDRSSINNSYALIIKFELFDRILNENLYSCLVENEILIISDINMEKI